MEAKYSVFIFILILYKFENKWTVKAQSTFPTVNTTKGSIMGLMVHIQRVNTNFTLEKYMGIPFAKPPVGSLRFKRPEPHPGWNNTFNGTVAPPACVGRLRTTGANMAPSVNSTRDSSMQLETSEDCLFLNVLVPKLTDAPGKNLPVFIFMHGGKFEGGYSLNTDLTNFAIETRVIVVSIAYRLHVYGFFSIHLSQEYPGNLGLWDQVLAFKWVKENIEFFGGDPNRVTIGGFSAGGRMTSMHMVSPKSKGLFQKAMSNSGTQLDFGAYSTQFASDSLLLKLNCTQKVSECILNATQADVSRFAQSDDFYPIIDGDFFPADPWTLIKEGKYNKVPYLLGMNSDEGLFLVVRILQNLGDNATAVKIKGPLIDIMEYGMSNFYNVSIRASLNAVIQLMRKEYLSEEKDLAVAIRQSINAFTDFEFTYPIKKMADAIATQQKEVYFYYLNHTPSATADEYERQLQIQVGGGHGDSVHLLYGTRTKPLNNFEKQMVQDFLYSLSSFMYSGKPSLSGAELSDTIQQEWPTYSAVNGSYVEFGAKFQGIQTFAIRNGFPLPRVSFWEKEIPAILANPKTDDDSNGMNQDEMNNDKDEENVNTNTDTDPNGMKQDEVDKDKDEAEDGGFLNLTPFNSHLILLILAVLSVLLLLCVLCVCYRRKRHRNKEHNPPYQNQLPGGTYNDSDYNDGYIGQRQSTKM